VFGAQVLVAAQGLVEVDEGLQADRPAAVAAIR